MLQLLRIIVLLVLVSSNCFASVNAIKEDSDPVGDAIYPWLINFPDGSITNNGDSTASISFGAGSIDGSGTTNELAYWSDSDTLGALAVATYPSLTELSYVKGVTSAIQTQLNAKESSTSNDFDPDRLAGDTTDNNLVDEAVIDSAIARDSELHSAVTVSDSSEIDFSLTGQQVSGSLVAGSIDETKLDTSVNASLDLADSALQSYSETDPQVDTVTSGNFCKGTGTQVSCTDSSTYLISEVDGSTTNELQNIFQTVSTTSGTAPVADSTTDTLTLTAGTGITVAGDSSTDTITIASTITDTNANTICSGTTTYLDGEGNCDDISSVYAPALGADDNYVTDAEKVVIGNTSGTNTGDQTTITGNAGTATALAANGANCSAGQYPLGVDSSGAVESCTADGGLLNIVEDTTPQLGGDLDSENKEIEDIKNLIIKGTAVGTSGDGVLAIYNGTIPSTSPANAIQIYSEDVTGAEATGGTISYSGGNTIHTFTANGTFTVPAGGLTVEYLVVGGGAGAGNDTAGGGGAGGYRAGSGLALTAGAKTVTIGAGGAANTNGSDSVFDTITATGGGKSSGINATPGSNGGSGGGGGGSSVGTTLGGASSPVTSPVQGYAGGGNGGFTASPFCSGGGGGSSAVGVTCGATGISGAGGAGTANSISGSSVTYACGGGGGVRAGGTPGAAGCASAGAGVNSGTGNSASANSGSGGGGGGSGGNGGAGGSGIVIISYPTPGPSAEAKVRDEAGNVTTLSPHNFKNLPKERSDLIEAQSDGLAWTYHSKNNCTYKDVMVDGVMKQKEDQCKEITVDMFTLVRLVEKFSGEQLIFSKNANIDKTPGEITVKNLKYLKAKDQQP